MQQLVHVHDVSFRCPEVAGKSLRRNIEHANDPAPSKLDLLHFAHRVVVQQATAALAQIDGWIAQEGERETRQRQAEEMRPPPPEWLLERDLNKTNLVAAHVGDCWTVRKSSRCIGVSQVEALGAPRQQVPACTHCRPNAELGFLPVRIRMSAYNDAPSSVAGDGAAEVRLPCALNINPAEGP
ncbi:DUF6233 domain-containing protein [Streptomyces sp. NPDC093228]|uniref:DUF6233 domain-containing protein n=1 Tax=unclassified Streptomyces TaxID=2593676 RepID=UPI002B403D04|nr:DUF6233 domain-containing protein [Streptomyces sp. 3212.3]